MRKREANQPRNVLGIEVNVLPLTVDNNAKHIKLVYSISIGVQERGEHTRDYMRTWEVC